MTLQASLSRRDLLAGGGALIVAFAWRPEGPAFADGLPPAKPLAPTEVDAYLAIDSSGAATIYSGKVDLGTGVRTALTQ